MPETDTGGPSRRTMLERIPGATSVARALRAGQRHHAKDMAASMAYFSFFSLFPLLVGIVAGASAFMDAEEVSARLDGLLADKFPGSASFVRSNVAALVELRGAAGLASAFGLLWSASKMFGALSRGVNLAFGSQSNQPYIISKLRYFGMALLVSLLAFLVAASSAILELLIRFDSSWFGRLAPLARWLSSHGASFALLVAALILVYRLVPMQKPSWSALVPGALVAAVLFELGKSLFALYLARVSNLQAVYGSLTSVIVLLLWLYFSARVLLFGAELTALREHGSEEP